ncbi:hypothetical protein LAZ67_22001697 [Cordylochernes scorpioides]|uniref:Uncharacterized protein n=1 Tax=Cordylochernes scorpioides TaxID=51811 RepID=A0ABY6LPJ2_9ARAC|nr:hypothetical protein LAZ67_22001697 [Cordylochernes scorpioides]
MALKGRRFDTRESIIADSKKDYELSDISCPSSEASSEHIMLRTDKRGPQAYNYHGKIGEEWTSGIGLTMEISITI